MSKRNNEEKFGLTKGDKSQLNNGNNQKKSICSNTIYPQKVTPRNEKQTLQKSSNEDKAKDPKLINDPSTKINDKPIQKLLMEEDALIEKDKEKEDEHQKAKDNADTDKEKDKDNNDANNKIKNNNNENNNNNNKDNDKKNNNNNEEKKIPYRFYINDSKSNVEELMFKNNKITTTKYNMLTFLPKALLFQFARIANVYFVAIAVIQCIPAISPLGWYTAIVPIVFVFSVSLIREAVEDLQRSRLDEKQNSDFVDTYRDGEIKKVQSGDLQMGELIKVYKDNTFPADLLLVDSSLQDGTCFIETGTLDGEKTLKIKECPSFTKGKINSFLNDKMIQNNIIKDNKKNNLIDSNSETNTMNKVSNPDSKSKDVKRKQPPKKKRTPNMSPQQQSGLPLIEDKINNFNSGSLSINDNENNNNDNNIDNINNDNVNDINNNEINNGKSKLEIKGEVQCDHPNPFLYDLSGKVNMNLNGEELKFGLDGKNMLLKGAKLKNTDWVIGIIIYTGHNCKIMKNSNQSKLKISSVEKLLNRLLVIIFIFQVILSIISSILHQNMFNKHKNLIVKYRVIDYLLYALSVDSFLTFFTYLLLLNTLIPISLIITLELVKIVQGIFMSFDVGTYSFVRKKFVKTNSVSLNEELGMVDYIFSDKTGTLTTNKMNLKFCVIGSQCYEYIRKGLQSDELALNKKFRKVENIIPFEDYSMLKSSSVKLIDTEIDEKSKLTTIGYNNYTIQTKNKEASITFENSKRIIEEYWKVLSLCHDCTIQEGEYVGMSPDNIELVKSARAQGFSYNVDKNSDLIINYTTTKTEINDIGKNFGTFKKLCHIEFSSERKRESILVKEGNVNKLYIKGADNVIEKLLDDSTPKEILSSCKRFVDLFSSQGYRTLYVAMRLLSEKETEEFLKAVEIANMETEDKPKKFREVYATVENSLTLIGATIVEDKLQENVPEVIREIREASIKIWMLTGDKLTTAKNIGLSCNLISQEMKIFEIVGRNKSASKEEKQEAIQNFSKEYNKFIGSEENGYLEKNRLKKKFGILVDDNALRTILEDHDSKKIFLEVAKDAVAVICCRVSPLQKSQVVKMMKDYDKTKITLAIGDGGNDVSMICEAHIGIGIYGEEGPRAAQSSDYAIGEFQILKRLLFFHGYLNLMRNSVMIIYFFYKNFVFTIVHFLYGFLNDFSGQTIIDDWFITLYNLIFTSIPLAGRGILDISLRPEDGKIVEILMPYLYKEQREYPVFTVEQFILNLVKGALHSLINYYITIYSIDKTIGADGYESNLWVLSVTLYTNILLIVTFDLIIFTKYHTIINWLLIFFLTFFLYIIFLCGVQRMTMFNSVGTMQVTFNSLIIWMNFLLVCGLCSLVDIIILSFKTFFLSSIYHNVELISKKNNLDLNYINGLPEEISDKILYNLPFYPQFRNKNNNNNNNNNNNKNSNNNNNDNNKNNDNSVKIAKNDSITQLKNSEIELNSKSIIDNKNPEKDDSKNIIIKEEDAKVNEIKIVKEINIKKSTNNIYKNSNDTNINENKINLNQNHNGLMQKSKYINRGSDYVENKNKKDAHMDERNKLHHKSDRNIKKTKQGNNINTNDKKTNVIKENDNAKENKIIGKKSTQCDSTERKRLINNPLGSQKI